MGRYVKQYDLNASFVLQYLHLADIVDQLEMKPRKRIVFVSFPRLVLFDKCSILAYHGQKCQKVLPDCQISHLKWVLHCFEAKR